MEIYYEETALNKQLVLKVLKSEGKESFRITMLQNNEILGILPLEIHYEEEYCLYYYSVVNKKRVQDVIAPQGMSYEQIKNIMKEIVLIIKNSCEYMLKENDFILNMEHLYLDQGNHVKLCYCEGYGKPVMEQLRELVQCLMNKVDYQSEEAVMFVYRFYQAVNMINLNMTSLLQSIEELERQIQKRYYEEEKKADIQEKPPIKSDVIQPVKKEMESEKSELRVEKKLKIENRVQFDEKTKINKNQHTMIIQRNKTKLITGMTVLGILMVYYLCCKFGILFNQQGELDAKKLGAITLILGIVEGYVLWRVYSKVPEENEGMEMEDESEIIQEVNHMDEIVQSRETKVTVRERDTEVEDKQQFTTVLIVEEKVEKVFFELKPQDHEKNDKIQIKSFPFVVGQGENGVNARIPVSSVSRNHAEFILEGDQLFVRDLGSTNGTYVNHQRIMPTESVGIVVGDILHFANIAYQVVEKSSKAYL